MELIFILAKFVQFLVVDPVWWVRGRVAALFYPEYTNEYLVIAWIVCGIIVFLAVATIMLYAHHA